MTNAGLTQALDFLAGVCPAQERTEQMVAAWRLKLDRFADDVVMKALWDLADEPRLRIDVGDVFDRCKAIRRTQVLREPREQLTPFGEDPSDPHDQRWNNLTNDERDHWLDKALASWPDLPAIRRDSPIIRAHAAALERGVPMNPQPDTPAGRCRGTGCGGTLRLVDRATATAKCGRCRCEFILSTGGQS